MNARLLAKLMLFMKQEMLMSCDVQKNNSVPLGNPSTRTEHGFYRFLGFGF